MDIRVTVNDAFWNKYRELVRAEMIPYQWDVLNDAIDINIEKERDDDSIPSEKSHAIENFKIAAGRSKGEHYGWVFQDSDVYKWLEAVAYSLKYAWDDELKKTADSVVDLISEAQEADGYLNTYFTIKEPSRKYKRLAESHELYCAGHFIEAAVAYYEATSNEKVLSTARKLADHIFDTFGEGEGKLHDVDGHEEIEIGLMRLYHLTDNEKYMRTAEYFLRERGKDPDLFAKQRKADGGEPVIAGLDKAPNEYFQAHLPVEKQDTAEGHAVRVVYLCTALADLAATTKDKKLEDACRRLWRNIVDKRMYITGGIGSTVIGEAFTLDYDLPNDTMYCETCASIGLIFFARQMLRLEADAEYADIMERALYNTALSGMALDGKHFFYVNPLEAVPEKSEKDPTKSHVKIIRPEWLGCACCPPNLARMIASLDRYIYTVNENEILINLFIKSAMEYDNGSGRVSVRQETDYPGSGKIEVSVVNESNEDISIAIRIPNWCDAYSGSFDGQEQKITKDKGYWYIKVGKGTHEIGLEMEIKPKRWYANPKVSEDIGKVAISRGPQVYCIEGVDNGDDLHCVYLPEEAELDYEWQADLLGGVGVIEACGIRYMADSDKPLYSSSKERKSKEQKIRMIPYYAWANRGRNEMRVWLNEA
ncbi:MAG: glycoside hydrolase family 127 protein [Lachnospiraceae bacterium]|nr:glycoside hydrolase family 127 protein [Lachnospiraceae bacterium]